MSTISAALVKDLRDKTGAGMMDCKAALGETNGDIEAAVDWLRKKGLAKAAKKAGRVAAEGLIGLAQSGASAALVEVNSETDFVARNPEFQALVTGIAGVALKTGTDVAAISAAPLGGATVAEKLASAIATIGENMTLRRAARLEVSAGAVGTYMHAAAAPGLGKIGVLVGLQSAGQSEALAQFGKMLAMHIAAANPLAVEPEQIDPAVVAREKAVLADKAAAAGKPANMIEKIVEGGIKTYFKEVCLLSQAYIHDPSKTVTQALKEAEAAAGAPVKVTAFIRFALGEGIEKQESDFAAEVAAAVKG